MEMQRALEVLEAELVRKEETEVGVVQKRLVVTTLVTKGVGGVDGVAFWGHLECNDGWDYWRRNESGTYETVAEVLADMGAQMGPEEGSDGLEAGDEKEPDVGD